MLKASLICVLCITGMLTASAVFSSSAAYSSSARASFQRPCKASDGVTVVEGVSVNNVVDGEDRPVSRAPVITLQGAKYLVEQRYTGGGAERTAFNKMARAGARLKEAWKAAGYLDTYDGEGTRNEKYELRKADFPSGRCLITFWAREEGVPQRETGSRHREISYSKCSVTGAGSDQAIELIFSDSYTTATVKVYRSQ